MLEVKDFVKANLYEDEDAVIQDALRHLLRGRPDLRIRLAVFRYQHEALSLAKAAEIAGVSWAQMRDILLEQDVEPALGPASLEEAQAEVNQLRDHLARQA